jgi:PhoPQ-activated pathogenicity-related protein
LALGTLAAFFAQIATDTPLPVLDWSHADADAGVILRVTSSVKPVASRLWVAHSPTKDFREAKWEPRKLEKRGGQFAARVSLPDEGHVAHYGELQFEFKGHPYSLCTLVRRD